MTGLVWAGYTLEFKQEAVRLVRGGQTVSSVAKTLGLSGRANRRRNRSSSEKDCGSRLLRIGVTISA